jgi:tripartite-type tricarboxylate transporter receptor subunit TctC
MRPIARILAGLVTLSIAQAIPSEAFAQAYPSRTVRIVVPNAPGGPTDIVARVLAQKMSDSMGQPVIVENRLGAGGVVGTELVAHSAPDGYTVMFSASGAMVITPHLNSKLPYETFRDFSPVSLGATAPMILIVGPNSTAKSVQDLIAQAKAQPGKLNYSTAGIGTPPHLGVELLKTATGIDVVHVPYKGAPQADTAVMTGEVAFMFTQPVIVNVARAGKVKMLGISSARRSALAPDVPTLAESGVPGFEVTAWYGMFAPAKTPDDVVVRLNGEMQKALAQKDVVDRLQSLGFEPPAPHSSAEFLSFLRRESGKWQKVIKDAGIKSE